MVSFDVVDGTMSSDDLLEDVTEIVASDGFVERVEAVVPAVTEIEVLAVTSAKSPFQVPAPTVANGGTSVDEKSSASVAATATAVVAISVVLVLALAGVLWRNKRSQVTESFPDEDGANDRYATLTHDACGWGL